MEFPQQNQATLVIDVDVTRMSIAAARDRVAARVKEKLDAMTDRRNIRVRSFDMLGIPTYQPSRDDPAHMVGGTGILATVQISWEPDLAEQDAMREQEFAQ